jgi:hypothetical protein
MPAAGSDPERIDVNDPQACAEWARKLDATEEELRESVAAVGNRASDIEMHLKGVRSTTNSDRMREELGRE